MTENAALASRTEGWLGGYRGYICVTLVDGGEFELE